MAIAASSCGQAQSPELQSQTISETSSTLAPIAALPAPQTRGLDPVTMDRTIEQAERLTNLRSLIVMRHGEELVARRFNGSPNLDRPVNIKSASKSVISALVGIAIEQDIMDGPKQTVLSLLAGSAPDEPDPRLSEITVADLLSMQAGLERTSGAGYGPWVVSDNWVEYVLERPFVRDPGRGMIYSTGSTHLLSAMLTESSGRSTWALARDWLGEPLDIAVPQWVRDPQGIYLGGNQMSMSPRAMAKFGELYRNGGKVGDEQILPAEWIEQSWTPRTISPWSGETYGYGWFISEARGHDVYYAWGYGGQMIFIVPDLEMTVVMTSATDVPRGGRQVDALRSLLANGIIPAAEIGHGDGEG